MPAAIDIERLYDDHAQALFSFLLNFTSHEADTRDLLQEVFIKLAEHPGLLAGVREERPFLLRLARNLAIDQARRRGTRVRHHDRMAEERSDWFAPAPAADERAFQEALAAALRDLPAEQREAVYLKLWEGLTFAKIAEVLQIQANTAASRYRYGLDKLRDRLRPLYDEIK
jgi:RNA polymerase sigma-70 factor, ECF subfamily